MRYERKCPILNTNATNSEKKILISYLRMDHPKHFVSYLKHLKRVVIQNRFSNNQSFSLVEQFPLIYFAVRRKIINEIL